MLQIKDITRKFNCITVRTKYGEYSFNSTYEAQQLLGHCGDPGQIGVFKMTDEELRLMYNGRRIDLWHHHDKLINWRDTL